MDPQHNPDIFPETRDLEAPLPLGVYALEKSLMSPREIAFSFSPEGNSREEELEKLSTGLAYIESWTRLPLSTEELKNLIKIVSREYEGSPYPESADDFAGSMTVSNSRSFRLNQDGCRSRISSQIILSQAEAPVSTEFILELKLDAQTCQLPQLVFHVVWAGPQNGSPATDSADWRMADPVLFALTGSPLPEKIYGQDEDSLNYRTTLSPQIEIRLAYMTEPPEFTRSFRTIAFRLLSPAIVNDPTESASVEASSEEVLTRSNCVVGSVEIRSPEQRELNRALWTLGIDLPVPLITYLFESLNDDQALDPAVMTTFAVTGAPIKISQSYNDEPDDAPFEEEDEDEREEFADDDLDQEEDDDESTLYPDSRYQTIKIELAQSGQREELSITLSVSDEFSPADAEVVVKLEFYSVSNCFTEEQLAERWGQVESFITACNGPEIPAELSSLKRLVRDNESDSYQLDAPGRFLITPDV